MTSLLEGLKEAEETVKVNPTFPNAPVGWTRDAAVEAAKADGLKLSDDHWLVVRALQEFYAKHKDTASINVRELHDALDEKFHKQGGRRYLFQLFPGGPVAQGCRLAGLRAPANAVDKGFGSVV